jgi:hypothetical protein
VKEREIEEFLDAMELALCHSEINQRTEIELNP